MKDLLRKSGLFLTVLLVIGYGIIALRGPNGVSALTEKREQIRKLQDQNASLAADNKRKRERIELLKNDRAAQELAIREKLKLLRPGETQFILPDAPKTDSPTEGTKPEAKP
jgi:cell division protein FtsB